MHGIRGDHRKVRTGTVQRVQFRHYVLLHRSPVVTVTPVDVILKPDAVDHDLRVTVVAEAFGILSRDILIIIDRRFRAEAAQDADCFQAYTLTTCFFLLGTDCIYKLIYINGFCGLFIMLIMVIIS